MDYGALKEKLRREGLAERKAFLDSTAGSPAQTSMRYGSMTDNEEQVAERPWFQTGEFDTKLDPEKEKEFRSWAVKRGIDRDLEDYDLRGAWMAKAVPEPRPDGKKPHGTDLYKKPWHPTFSSESIYAAKVPGAGRWEQGRFVVGPANLRYRSWQDLTGYFQEHEPEVELDWTDIIAEESKQK